jgi:hypothetical protein
MPSSLNDAEKTARIREVAGRASEEMRRRHPWLEHQDAIGLGILVFSLSGMAGCAWLYWQGAMPAWLCVPLVAICASLVHELEHDLIHYMYFRDRPVVHNLMLAIGWLVRPSTINPWIRRHIHLHHHKHSGTRTDVEERGITNGEPWSARRLLMIGDGLLAIILRAVAKKGLRPAGRTVFRGLAAYFPVGWIHFFVWYCFLGFHAVDGLGTVAGHPVAWSETTLANMRVVDFLTVVLIGPNVLRSFCLHFVSSNMHTCSVSTSAAPTQSIISTSRTPSISGSGLREECMGRCGRWAYVSTTSIPSGAPIVSIGTRSCPPTPRKRSGRRANRLSPPRSRRERRRRSPPGD